MVKESWFSQSKDDFQEPVDSIESILAARQRWHFIKDGRACAQHGAFFLLLSKDDIIPKMAVDSVESLLFAKQRWHFNKDGRACGQRGVSSDSGGDCRDGRQRWGHFWKLGTKKEKNLSKYTVSIWWHTYFLYRILRVLFENIQYFYNWLIAYVVI